MREINRHVPFIKVQDKRQVPEIIQHFRNEGIHGNMHIMKGKDGGYIVNVKRLEKQKTKSKNNVLTIVRGILRV